MEILLFVRKNKEYLSLPKFLILTANFKKIFSTKQHQF